jgi:Ca-activated chloride channel family protein
MVLLWPGFLILLVLIPLLIGVYIWMLRRRGRFALRFSSLALVREALPHQSRLRRHLPFAIFLLALTCLIMTLTRPAAIVSLPTDQTTIILTMDVSGSMRFRDVRPSRLSAAEDAAVQFIQRQKSTTNIGLVAFSGFAELIMPPTTDQDALQTAIQSLTTGRATAIGSGILEAIDAIAEIDPSVAKSVRDGSSATEPPPVAKGAYVPDIIVLLTDGVSNAGVPPLEAAQQAADRGIRIYTIGFGTAEGPGPGQYGGAFGGGNNFNPFGGNGQPPARFRRGIDETMLKEVADQTGGKYYAAASASELQEVFQSLPTYFITRHGTQEISVAFAALGALLAASAVVLSLIWQPLP